MLVFAVIIVLLVAAVLILGEVFRRGLSHRWKR